MARIFGITGKMKGKYGNAVFRVRRGTQVMAQYNPSVDNPNTDKQVAARSRMKLMSQLGAIYQTIIAIPREGAVTSRNLFTKVNYPLSAADLGKASVNLPAIQLTKSAREMPAFTVTRSSGLDIQCALVQAAKYDRVVYAVVAKNANENLRVFASQVVENEAGIENTFAAKLPYTSEAIVVYAYAITDNNGRASASFGNIKSPTAEEVASLITSRSLLSTDYTATATGGAYLEVGTTDAVSAVSSGIGGEPQNQIPNVPTIGGYSPFAEYTDVVMSAGAGCTIHYTTDGSAPTQASEQYASPIRITETTTFKAIAVKNGVASNVTTRTLTKEAGQTVVVVAPVISGTTPFQTTTEISMTAEAGARIYYTVDGSNPTEASTLYENPFSLSDTTTVKAIARLQDTNSAVTTKVFTKGSGNPQTE